MPATGLFDLEVQPFSSQTSFLSSIFKKFWPLPGVFTARGAIELIVFYTVHPELVEGLVISPLRSTRSPASYRWAIASKSFLKTHAIQVSVN
jgi:hypothetical protein